MPIHPRTFILINLLLKLYKLSHLLSLRFKSLTSLIQSYQSQTNGEGEEQRGEREAASFEQLSSSHKFKLMSSLRQP